MLKNIKILDIPFAALTMEEALLLILQHMGNPASQRPFFIATPNPEMLLEARKNIEFKKILQHTDLNIPDGIGIILASRLQKTPLPARVTGTDMMEMLCRKAPFGTKIFLLGAAPGVAEKVKEELTTQFCHIHIVGTYSGSPAPEEEKDILKLIQQSKPDMLFVAYGAPKQEMWLHRNKAHLGEVKIVMGVGGAFDFIAKIRKRAPLWMQKMGLEWLYRLIQEPKRIKRIYNATVKFTYVFITSRFQK